MEHRRGVKIDRRRREQSLAERIQRIRHQVAVAEHHALGAPGGAAGVEDSRKLLPLAHRVRHRRTACDQRLVILHAGGRVGVVGKDRRQVADRPGKRGADRGEGAVDDQKPGAAIAQRVLVFKRAPADVERHDHGAGPCRRQIKFEIAVGIQHQHRDAVPAFDAERPERRRQPRHAIADLLPGPAAIAEDGRWSMPVDLQRAPQTVSHVHVVLPEIADCIPRVSSGLSSLLLLRPLRKTGRQPD